MMQGDDIRNQRMQAEEDAKSASKFGNYHEARASLALWVIAEQLYEVRSLVSISLERNK